MMTHCLEFLSILGDTMGCSSSISVTEQEEQVNEAQSVKSEYYIEKLTHISADISEVASSVMKTLI